MACTLVATNQTALHEKCFSHTLTLLYLRLSLYLPPLAAARLRRLEQQLEPLESEVHRQPAPHEICRAQLLFEPLLLEAKCEEGSTKI